MVLAFLARQSNLEVTATTRSEKAAKELGGRLRGVQWRLLDAEHCSVDEVRSVVNGASWAVNAIGVIKPYIHDDNAAEVERATRINAVFPHLLAKGAERCGCRILQIATDCVYSGGKGYYVETDRHDPLDVYGKTKSLGEVYSPNAFHLRCSIIGPEPKAHVSLLDWFLRQEKGAVVNGFTNHLWNGITTLHFAKLCYGIISNNLALPHVQHVIPTGRITKFDLLQLIAESFNRTDLKIDPTEARTAIDRTLGTTNEILNRKLWEVSGFPRPPSISEMVSELAAYEGFCPREMVTNS
jgi:dTDP-4-dehydrorhamnose reductase